VQKYALPFLQKNFGKPYLYLGVYKVLSCTGTLGFSNRLVLSI